MTISFALYIWRGNYTPGFYVPKFSSDNKPILF